MKKCPFCAEEIQDEAVKCKHCGELLKKEESITEKILIDERPAMISYLGLFVIGALLILVWGIGILFIVGALIHRVSRRYIITNKRVIIEKGILGKDRDEIDIAHIRNISSKQNFDAKILGYGKILIGTAGTAGYEIVMTAIKNPIERIALIKNLQIGKSINEISQLHGIAADYNPKTSKSMTGKQMMLIGAIITFSSFILTIISVAISKGKLNILTFLSPFVF